MEKLSFPNKNTRMQLEIIFKSFITSHKFKFKLMHVLFCNSDITTRLSTN